MTEQNRTSYGCTRFQVSSAGRLDIDAFGVDNILLVVAFVGALTIAGWILPMFFGLAKHDVSAVQMEVVVRNVNLGVLIKASMFPVVVGATNTLGDMVLFTVLLYDINPRSIPIVWCLAPPHRGWLSQRTNAKMTHPQE